MNNYCDYITSAFLGIVEGLTEFIPVSSTGHLILFGNLVGFTGEKADLFEVFIQLGGILAVLVLYYKRFLSFLDFSTSNKSEFSGISAILKISACVIPTLFFGFLLHAKVKLLFSPLPVALALILGGVIFIVLEKFYANKKNYSLDTMPVSVCFLVGLFQSFSLWPGISRSGSSIAGAMFLGLERKAAAEFSFLVAVPVISAAVLYDLYKNFALLSFSDLPIFMTGFIFSFFVGVLAIRVFVELLAKYTLVPFGVYRILLGIFVLIFIN